MILLRAWYMAQAVVSGPSLCVETRVHYQVWIMVNQVSLRQVSLTVVYLGSPLSAFCTHSITQSLVTGTTYKVTNSQLCSGNVVCSGFFFH